MANQILIDTDVLIDYLRGQADAVQYIETRGDELVISAVTVAELYSGVREGDERTRLDRFLRAFEILPLDEQVAMQGGLLRRDWSRTHRIGLADAMIAAAAAQRQIALVMLNQKHFPMLKDVIVPYQKG